MFIYPSPDASFVLYEFSMTMGYCHSEVKGVGNEAVRVLRQAQDARILSEHYRRMLSSEIRNEIPTGRDRTITATTRECVLFCSFAFFPTGRDSVRTEIL